MKNLIFLSEGENQRELNEKIGVYFLNYLFLHNLSFHSLYIYIFIFSFREFEFFEFYISDLYYI